MSAMCEFIWMSGFVYGSLIGGGYRLRLLHLNRPRALLDAWPAELMGPDDEEVRVLS